MPPGKVRKVCNQSRFARPKSSISTKFSPSQSRQQRPMHNTSDNRCSLRRSRRGSGKVWRWANRLLVGVDNELAEFGFDIIYSLLYIFCVNASPKSLLRQIGRIQHMERGKLCSMPGRPFFNHQTWENGRNLVRYVPRDQIEPLRKAMEGYRRFQQLIQKYAALVIEKSRQQRAQNRQFQKIRNPKLF